jgi:hypothetical protein
MRISKNDVPVKIDAPGAVARQQPDFGDASGFGKISGEYFSLGAGADLAPLLAGLEGDLCQCPHWGYVLHGALTVTYAISSATGEPAQGRLLASARGSSSREPYPELQSHR